MEWFKHKTSAHSDPVISDAWDEFGDAAYVIWFVLLEVYGEQYKSSNPDKKLNVSKAFIKRKFRKSWTKVEQILNFYSTFGKLDLEITPKRVIIGIPKFTEILSNWTKRQTLNPTEAPTEAPTAKSKSKSKIKNKEPSSSNDEVDFLITRKKKKLNGKRFETFMRFWDAFAYKSGRAEAADAWLEIPELTNSVVEQIISAAKIEAKRRPEILSKGKTPKMAQGWISGRRWEDESYNSVKDLPNYLTPEKIAELNS